MVWMIGILLIGLGIVPLTANAQSTDKDLTGIWVGALDVNTIKLRLVFEVTRKEKGYTAILKSLDQGGQPIPCSEATLSEGNAHFGVAIVNGGFDGKLSADGNTLTGTWMQGGGSLPLTLTRSDAVPTIHRPQEPKPPYPYTSEDVTYPSLQAGVTLAGTLTLPKGTGPFPVALLITGSGPQNRDEEILGHKPFLVLSDYLTRHGIAVLRVDDRGIAKSTGNFATATSADFAEDVRGGVAYLKTRKEIDPKKIGLIGHSEGGFIAPMIASTSKDISFIVMMAGPGVPGNEIVLEQSALIAKSAGEPDSILTLNRNLMTKAFSIIKAEPDNAAARTKIESACEQEVKALPSDQQAAAKAINAEVDRQMGSLLSPWFRYFLTTDPRDFLRKVTCPTLAINGAKDMQVPPKQNLPEIQKALTAAGNTHFVVKELPGLNHLFQTCTTGAPSEYSTIEETIAPIALETIGDWIHSTVQ
jgi:pimeloyl-ACP methyl ester carboxylesterase